MRAYDTVILPGTGARSPEHLGGEDDAELSTEPKDANLMGSESPPDGGPAGLPVH